MLGPLISLLLCAGAELPDQPLLQPDRFGQLRPCRTATVLIGLRPEAAARTELEVGLDELKVRFSNSGARVTGHLPRFGILRAEVGPGEEPVAACERLRNLPEARYAEPDWMGEGGYVVNDTYFIDEWHLKRIQAPEAWDITRGSADVIVAILDTGIARDHPEFVGRALPGYDFVNGDDDPTADHPHGLYTTGLLAANADNGFGVAGVNHFSRILPVKVLDNKNTGTDWNLVQGIGYAVDNGARVISMSLINFPESNALTDALRYAREHGVVLVACSGNNGVGNADVSWPGASPLCITVGATDASDRRASFSGTGQALDVVAPGDSVVTVSPESGDLSSNFSGCSAATPIAAGVVSLLLSADPTLTPEEVQDVLQHGAEDQVGGSDDRAGWDPNYGWGRVNALRSLKLLGNRFLRGDANFDGGIDISDPIFILVYLFADGDPVRCLDAADSNDDGGIDLADPVLILNSLFLGGTMTGPGLACGLDLTEDGLSCQAGCSR